MADTRDRIVTATAELLQRRGYKGTGLKQISTTSGAPFGSLYHFFPGGKEQLSAAALRTSGRSYLSLIEAYFDDPSDYAQAITEFFEGAAEVLRASDYADACPIATVALEVASTNETLRQVTAEVFEEWIEEATVRFERAGVSRQTARELVTVAFAALEGAFVLCRATKSTEAMGYVGRVVGDAVRRAIADADGVTPSAG